MVVLKPSVSAHEAVRALEHNHVGAIVVQEARNVVGVATDRDLALRVIGQELDPKHTALRDVMTPAPHTLAPRDTEYQAAILMRTYHVRRIPIVEQGRAVGIVTLDDLILSGTVDVEMAGDIIDAQLSEPAPGKLSGFQHPVELPPTDQARHAARVEQGLREFVTRLQVALVLPDPERALTAFTVVAQGLVRRLTPTEASDFVSQLPRGVQDELLGLPTGPDRSVTLDAILGEMASRMKIDRAEARSLVRRIAALLPELLSAGEFEQVVNQLPSDIKTVFSVLVPRN
jgi:uncharacterized protein (DUF2267 family)